MTPISVSRDAYLKSSYSGSTGFTLLELMVVLTIIGMASILIAPNVGNIESRTFSAQVRQATSLLNYARRIAVVQGQPSTATFYAVLEEGGPGFEDENRRGNNIGIWESNAATLRFRDSTERETDIEDRIGITFYPEGGSTGGSLIFSLEDQIVTVVVDPFTGRLSTEYE